MREHGEPGRQGHGRPERADRRRRSGAGTKKYQASLIPLSRVGQLEEIAKTVLLLASDDASFVNGVELFVDGG